MFPPEYFYTYHFIQSAISLAALLQNIQAKWIMCINALCWKSLVFLWKQNKLQLKKA